MPDELPTWGAPLVGRRLTDFEASIAGDYVAEMRTIILSMALHLGALSALLETQGAGPAKAATQGYADAALVYLAETEGRKP
jgi:hypothetical protein